MACVTASVNSKKILLSENVTAVTWSSARDGEKGNDGLLLGAGGGGGGVPADERESSGEGGGGSC